MLRDSFQHAGGDMQARALREQQVDAQRLLEAVQSALEVDGELRCSATTSAWSSRRAMEDLRAADDGLRIRQPSSRRSSACRRLPTPLRPAAWMPLSGRPCPGAV